MSHPLVTVPAVYVDHQRHIHLVTNATPGTVTTVAIDGQTYTHRVVQFAKDFTVTQADPISTAVRMLSNTHLPPTEAAITQLKEIIMSEKNIIVVNQDGSLVGRFSDAAFAAKVSPPEAVCVSEPTDLSFLTKAQLQPLFASLGLPYNPKSVNVALYKTLLDHYRQQEVKVVESKTKVKKERVKKEKVEKEPVDRSTSRKAIVHKAWADGQTDVAELEKISNGVKVNTIKAWLAQWKRGINIPAYAKEKPAA